MTVYKTKITVTQQDLSPTIYGLKSAGVDQTVLVFDVTNTANVAAQDAIIRDLAVNIATSGTWATATSRDIMVYKNSISDGNRVGTATFTGTHALASVAFGAWTTSGSITDVTIGSGATVRFFVTVDTNEAATDARLTVSIPTTNGVKWYDGVTDNIVVVDNLSISGGTITY
jgi:hypothetical protein